LDFLFFLIDNVIVLFSRENTWLKSEGNHEQKSGLVLLGFEECSKVIENIFPEV
jgi:hypothetical protein